METSGLPQNSCIFFCFLFSHSIYIAISTTLMMVMVVQYITKTAIIVLIRKQLRNQHKEDNDNKNNTLAKDNYNAAAITPFFVSIAIPVQKVNQYNTQNTKATTGMIDTLQ